MYTVTLIPYFIYKSLQASNIPLEVLSTYEGDVSDVSKPVSTLDMLHIYHYNRQYNIFTREYNHIYQILRNRELGRYNDYKLENHLETGTVFDIQVTTNNLFVILNKDINSKVNKAIFNKLNELVPYDVLASNNIIKNYVHYVAHISVDNCNTVK